MSDLKIEKVLKQFLLSITGNDIMQTNNNNYDCIDKFIESDRYKNLLEQANGADKSTESALNLPVVSISLPSDEEIREPIQNAIYATGSYTTDQCTEFADGILTYLNEAGYKVVRQ